MDSALVLLIVERLKSKTYNAALLGAILTLIDYNTTAFSMLLPAGYRSVALALWPIIMIAMREVTNGPLSAKSVTAEVATPAA